MAVLVTIEVSFTIAEALIQLMKIIYSNKQTPFSCQRRPCAIFRVRRMSSVLLILHTKRIHASCCLVEHKVHPMSPLIAIFEVYLPTEQNNLAALF